MGMSHLIAESFREIAAGSQDLLDALPGGIYYGSRAEAENVVYPMGLLQVREDDREHNSGGGSLATYEMMLTVFSPQGQQYPGEITALFANYFHTNRIYFPAIPADAGRLVHIREQAGTLDEDPDDEFGRDTDRASVAWQITLAEFVLSIA